MCAISGIISYKGSCGDISPERKKKILATMERRGPDQNGIYSEENCLLFHSRLSVIDPDNGMQPMTAETEDGSYTIVYNGEIYNCPELKKRLVGVKFRTDCDTEVVLQLFIKYGEKAAAMLNGIFAFAIWDSKRQRLFIARDCIGVKPFFYTDNNGDLIFASEIKTLFKYPEIKPVIDMTSISELILMGPGRTPGCGVFCGIKELKPGEYAYISEAGIEKGKYRDLYDESFEQTAEEAVAEVRRLVLDSIERQLVSDVPLGAFLSGGLDSSLICSVAANKFREEGKELTAFSVYYKDNEKYFKPGKFQPNSDNEYIDVMVKYLNCRHEKITIDTPQLADALYDAVDARDLPGMADVDSSLLCFCREVKKSCTVVLSGECADEIFGGYPWFHDKEISRKKGFPWAQTTDWRASFLKADLADRINAADYVNNAYEDAVKNTPVLPYCSDDDRRTKLMMNLNMKWFMQTLLDRKDRTSMYSGLEVRVPFCDHRIAQYLYTVPKEIRDMGGHEKGLLREAARGLLPDEVLFRKKSPYPKTHDPSYAKEVSSRLSDIIVSPNEPMFDIVDREQLKTLYSCESTTPWYGQLMTVPQTMAYFIQLNYWLKKFRPEIRI